MIGQILIIISLIGLVGFIIFLFINWRKLIICPKCNKRNMIQYKRSDYCVNCGYQRLVGEIKTNIVKIIKR